MSIFPKPPSRDSGAHKQGAGADAPSQAKPGEETASSTTKKTKPHRFDKFALRLASGMITAIRVTLGVFSSPDKERWPFARLLDHLRGAESLAREMLREIAAEISIIPGKLRERRNDRQCSACANARARTVLSAWRDKTLIEKKRTLKVLSSRTRSDPGPRNATGKPGTSGSRLGTLWAWPG